MNLKTKRLLLIFLLAFGAIILSACSSAGISTNWPGLAADADRAYMSSGAFVYAVDLKNGQEVWRYPAASNSKQVFYASPVLTDDGQLLIGSAGSNHLFVSLNPETGRENWSEAFMGAKGAWLASPLVLNNTIYAPNTDGFLYILDLKGKQAADPIELGGALWSKPSTDGTSLYITSLDHHFHVLDLLNGSLKDPINIGGAAPGSPVVGKDGVYVGSFASTIEFIQLNGAHKVIATADNWIWGTPALDGDTLYYADLGGTIYSLDLATGNQNWDAVQPDGPVVASLLVADDQLYAATEAGTLVALDRDGKTVWEKTVGGKIYTTPVVSGDLMLVAPYQAEFALAAFDAAGKQAWTFTPEK